MDEFTIINKYLKPLSLNNSGALKLSDDIFFDNKKKIAISLDTYVEGIHFIEATNPKKFLKRVLRASLSDLYCKGIKPRKYFLSFCLRKNLVNLPCPSFKRVEIVFKFFDLMKKIRIENNFLFERRS